MFSYYEDGITNLTGLRNKSTLTFKNLHSTIVVHPNVELVTELRKLEYGSEPYKKFKRTNPFPAIKPHGVFIDEKQVDEKGKIKDVEILKKLSGYIYFDVDYKTTKILPEDYKKILLDKHSDKICMCGKSSYLSKSYLRQIRFNSISGSHLKYLLNLSIPAVRVINQFIVCVRTT